MRGYLDQLSLVSIWENYYRKSFFFFFFKKKGGLKQPTRLRYIPRFSLCAKKKPVFRAVVLLAVLFSLTSPSFRLLYFLVPWHPFFPSPSPPFLSNFQTFFYKLFSYFNNTLCIEPFWVLFFSIRCAESKELRPCCFYPFKSHEKGLLIGTEAEFCKSHPWF